MTDRSGFIGLGNIGLPMAQRFLAAGHAPSVFDRGRLPETAAAREAASLSPS